MLQWDPFILTFKLATVTTVILFLLSVPLAYWLTYSRYKIKYRDRGAGEPSIDLASVRAWLLFIIGV